MFHPPPSEPLTSSTEEVPAWSVGVAAPAGPSQVLIVRHGATAWSEAGRHTGRTDVALLPLGVDQARRAGTLLTGLLAGEEPLVFTSPLERAWRTAQLALPRTEAVVVDALAEYDYGEFEGLTSAEIEQRHPRWNLFADGCPGGETLGQVTARCEGFVAKLERVAPGRAVVVFTHGHLGRVLTCRLLGLPSPAARVLQNDTASVAVLVVKRGELVLDRWNLV